MKLAIGTVQFGLKYGVNNAHGQTSLDEARTILDFGSKIGVELLDTAADYGTSEDVLGRLLANSNRFKFTTKTSRDVDFDESVNRSLQRLGVSNIYGVFVHDFGSFRANPKSFEKLLALKDQGKIEKIGFSVYLPAEVDYLLENDLAFDIVQLPYSVFDQRFEPYFGPLKEKAVEIHIRSVFLQGLVFMHPESLPKFFQPIAPKIEALNQIATISGNSIQALCLNFVRKNKNIDYCIIGVDNVQGLKSNHEALHEVVNKSDLEKMAGLCEENDNMILPYKWKIL